MEGRQFAAGTQLQRNGPKRKEGQNLDEVMIELDKVQVEL